MCMDRSMTDNKKTRMEELQAALQGVLRGACLYRYLKGANFTLTFLPRRDSDLPPELEMTLFGEWEFHGFEHLVAEAKASFTMIYPEDCAKAFALTGVLNKEVEKVQVQEGNLQLVFEGGAVMTVPTRNEEVPEDLAFALENSRVGKASK